MKITIEQTLSKKTFTNLITTAFEGGIGYWACLNNLKPEFDTFEKPTSEKVAEILWSGGSVELFDTDYDYDEADKWELTLTKFVKGLKQYLETNATRFELDDLDSYACDLIIQYALFDEIVFA